MKKMKTNQKKPGIFKKGFARNLLLRVNAGKNTLFFFSSIFFLIFFIQSTAISQSLQKLSAWSGTYAPWGKNQLLTIDATLSTSNARIYQMSMETDIIETDVTLTLTSAEMQTIMDTANAVGFFSLSGLYDGNASDGSGVYVEIHTTSAQNNAVEVKNVCNGRMNRLVRTINTIVSASGIQLGYNFLNDNCP